ncbi:MAG: class I SAM-dependent methyltransferase [Pseudomonadales bacterium]|jgi:SAM-dependent methyltransferase|nr:class I SAM-dependent methyltransferase [Pseudomonadales bacterium]MDP6471207.1 class I SAM-dependent methyltransferase [Pseudomonadales bacterium]MDP6825604.1 class I SAM-dependent methyltransferase [Pseudomonadales bacterium]MDP6970479.1 class I SAM-dependent methyltransferase [Pseudomonadales bacterium]|tara:strand:+ start:1291 stop:2055 length:765 start_codon:yes stop_codon:yes gene_type:complete
MSSRLELFNALPRQGPGSDLATASALAFAKYIPEHPRILDIGCGTGSQTLALARLTGGRITAVDISQAFLDTLARRAKNLGVASQVSTLRCSMDALDLPDDEFDLVWCEGAIYNVGFKRGLRALRRFLKPGGFLAVTELVWFTPDPPEPALRFWSAAYPPITTVDENVGYIEAAGYSLIHHFSLPASAWWDDYYGPLERQIEKLRSRQWPATEDLAFLDENQEEIELYRSYSECYGYEFFVMQKPQDARVHDGS